MMSMIHIDVMNQFANHLRIMKYGASRVSVSSNINIHLMYVC